jgi:roadblock/LC7 domain-containing protein
MEQMQSIGYKKECNYKLMIIGPSDLNKIFKNTNLSKMKYKSILKSAAKYLSLKFKELYIIPDNGVFLDFAIEFKKYKPVFAYLPDKKELKYEELLNNVKKYNFSPIYTKQNWVYLNNIPIRNVDFVYCLGYSSGVFIEIGNIKIANVWSNKKIKLIIDERFISSRLPFEISMDLPIIYIKSITEFENVFY